MADDRRADLLKKVTTLATTPEDMSQEAATATLSFALDKVIDDVCAYTHIDWEKLPTPLNTTLVSMVLHAVAELGLLASINGESGQVSSLSEGDESVSFLSPLDALDKLSGANTVTGDFLRVLNTYRVVKW